MLSFKGATCPQDIILMGVHWYVTSPVSTRHVEELLLERGVPVDHSPVHRWVITYSPQLEEAFHCRQRPVWVSWRRDETSIRGKGQWASRYRAVDKTGQTSDLLVTEQRDEQAAQRVLTQAMHRHGVPEKSTLDGSEATAAAIHSDNQDHGTTIVIRQVQYVHTIVEHDHRAVKRITRPMLGFTAGEAAQSPLAGVELTPMIQTRQRKVEAGDEHRPAAEQFYALAS